MTQPKQQDKERNTLPPRKRQRIQDDVITVTQSKQQHSDKERDPHKSPQTPSFSEFDKLSMSTLMEYCVLINVF